MSPHESIDSRVEHPWVNESNHRRRNLPVHHLVRLVHFSAYYKDATNDPCHGNDHAVMSEYAMP